MYAHYCGTPDVLLQDFYGVKSRVKSTWLDKVPSRSKLWVTAKVRLGAEYRALSWIKYWCISVRAGGHVGTAVCERETEGTVNTSQECTATSGELAIDRNRVLAEISRGRQDTSDKLALCRIDCVTRRVVQVARARNDAKPARPRVGPAWEQSSLEPTWLAGGEIYATRDRYARRRSTL